MHESAFSDLFHRHRLIVFRYDDFLVCSHIVDHFCIVIEYVKIQNAVFRLHLPVFMIRRLIIHISDLARMYFTVDIFDRDLADKIIRK